MYWLIVSHSRYIIGKQRLRINNKEIMLRWQNFETQYKGNMASFSCRQTSANVQLLAVTFKLGTELMENIKV